MRKLNFLLVLFVLITLGSCSDNSSAEELYDDPQAETPSDNQDQDSESEQDSEADPESQADQGETNQGESSENEGGESGEEGSDETDDIPTALLGELILTSPDLKLFAEALQFLPETVLDQLNNPDANLTLFAPTDQAIQELLDALGDNYQDLSDFDSSLEQDILAEILTYHMITGSMLPEDMEVGALLTLLNDESLFLMQSENTWLVYDALERFAVLTDTPLQAANGIIYPIETILIPEEAAFYLGL